MCDSCGCEDIKVIELNKSLYEKNREMGEKNRLFAEKKGAKIINLISAPGSGKTTLLEATIDRLKSRYSIGVIEGDIETERDAERIRKKGVEAIQITTGGSCHLDAPLVHKGLHELFHLKDAYDLIFIENVGNLVCPASFYLGEHIRAVLVSVPEGSDKPEKYPVAFKDSGIFAITKIDLLDYFDFSIEEAKKGAKKLNPHIKVIEISATTGQGLDEWIKSIT